MNLNLLIFVLSFVLSPFFCLLSCSFSFFLFLSLSFYVSPFLLLYSALLFSLSFSVSAAFTSNISLLQLCLTSSHFLPLNYTVSASHPLHFVQKLFALVSPLKLLKWSIQNNCVGAYNVPGKLRDGRQQEWDWKWKWDKRAAAGEGTGAGKKNKPGRRATICPGWGRSFCNILRHIFRF